MIISLYIIALPCSWYIGIHNEEGIIGLWTGLAIGMFSASVVFAIALLKVDW